MGRDRPDRSESPVRGRRSPHRRSPPRRERSPTQHKSSRRGNSPPSEKHSSHAKSPKPERTNSYATRSPSPRTKRLKKAQTNKGTEAVAEKNHEKILEKGTDRDYARDPNRERDLDREAVTDRKARRSVRDDGDRKSSRSRHRNSTSPSERHQKSRHRSESPRQAPESKDRHEVKNARGVERRMEEEEEEDDSVAKMKAAEEALETKEKQKPSFELSGKLAAETNRVRGVTLLFTEPPEARKPDVRWRLYVFKAGEVLNEPLYIHRQSCYLFGRERRVADVPTDHPSCSKQHAVIQFRQIEKEQPDGLLKKHIRPYLMDLGSTNKTFINDNAVEPQRYYELFERDTVRFGNSSREYVLLHENSAA